MGSRQDDVALRQSADLRHFSAGNLRSAELFSDAASQEGANWTYGIFRAVTASAVKVKVDWVHVWQASTSTPSPKKDIEGKADSTGYR
jgi:hypothetical protein